MEAKPVGSITDKLFTILEGASVLVQTANKISMRIGKRPTITLPRHEVELMTKQLREAAVMIDNLLNIIEKRELPALDKIGNVIIRPMPSVKKVKAR